MAAISNKPVYAPTTSITDVPTAPLFSPSADGLRNPQLMNMMGMAVMPNVMVGNHRVSNSPAPETVASAAAIQQQQQLFLQQQHMMMLNAMHLQQQQAMMAMNMNAFGFSNQQSYGNRRTNNSSNNNGKMMGSSTTTPSARTPSTPFNPAAAMPLEDMIVAYNAIKAKEIEMQAEHAQNVLSNGEPFVSPFIEYACSQQGKLVLQGLLHFEDEVAVAQDLFSSVIGHIEAIALNEHGCHVIRALGEKIGHAAPTSDEHDEAQTQANNDASLLQFVAALNETLFLNICTLSQESRRIPQALFETYNAAKPDLLTPLVDIVARNVLYLSATQQGCIAFMRMYEASNYAQKRHMAANLVRILADLSCDSFGNYVVQCLVEHSELHVAAQYVSSAFVGQCVRLACNKFASNVLEKVVRKLSHIPSVRRVIVDELIFDLTNATIACEDSYANFVIQTVIETSTNAAEFRKIYDRVKMADTHSMYAAKIEARLRSKSFFANTAANNELGHPQVTVGVAPTMPTALGMGVMNMLASTTSSNANTSANSSRGGPVYNSSTATPSPVIPMVSENSHLPVDPAIVTSAPKRSMGSSQYVPTAYVGNDQENMRRPYTNNRCSNNSRQQAAPTAAVAQNQKSRAPASPKHQDPLQAEAKRLMSSDAPPTSFTPYKPSPFSDRSNRQNIENNNTQQVGGYKKNGIQATAASPNTNNSSSASRNRNTNQRKGGSQPRNQAIA
eukprot:GILJ01015616.1.p1 GENE.GILJ01015616.1~~GILJ01015616.1.p1  ORF type:complete len:728 (+),score=177.41 GILJ01015616.1:242-2425(+)